MSLGYCSNDLTQQTGIAKIPEELQQKKPQNKPKTHAKKPASAPATTLNQFTREHYREG